MKNSSYKIYVFALCCLFITTQSCKKWLDVQPKSEVKASVLFESEEGFKDALFGVYIQLTSSALYGREMTTGLMDVLAQNYTSISSIKSRVYYEAAEYNYANNEVLRKIDNIWSTAYNAISNVNNILDNLDAKKSIMHPTNYAVIKGEALAIRAFIHFDLLRVFGYGNMLANSELSNQRIMPYSTKYEKEIVSFVTQKDVLENIHKDLDEALELLSYYDTWGPTPKEDDYLAPNEDRFFSKRQKRFNYYAALAISARVYMWEGDYENALEAAQEVNGVSGKIYWISESSLSGVSYGRDYTFTPEHILALDVNKLYENNLKAYISSGSSDNATFYHSQAVADEIFEITKGGSSDFRYFYLYESKGAENHFLKFIDMENYAFPNNMPIIKKPEMYYVAAECLNRSDRPDDRKKAIELINTVRRHRNLTIDLSSTLTKEQVDEEIYKEYKKEFLCEGQLFFFYKRLGYSKIDGTNKQITNSIYILPIPLDEQELGKL